MAVEGNIKQLFSATPGAVRRQGEPLFVKTPLYRAKRRHVPVYIDKDLFKKLFRPGRDPGFTEMAALLEPFFSTTIEKENGTGEEIGTAWVDRQADPLNLSLSGNQGSGRAYYAGGVFNIKGERTPLATSAQKRFSDGYLEMERCIWEALVANGLQGAITNGLNGVLAILDMSELCEVEWRDAPVKRGKIIRIDEDGALDRITHLFANGRPLGEGEFLACAEGFGRLEGDKFAERIIHGTWSPGNISPRGHLIDFDTVGAVKGRSPQFSSSRWHHENYFGFEYEGQSNVLGAMAGDAALNPAGVTHARLRETMLEALRRQVARRLPELMGFAGTETLARDFAAELDALAELWRELARKGYKQYEAFSTKHGLACALHVFDFSAFFRAYPLLRRAGKFRAEDCVARMAEHQAWEDPFRLFDESGLEQIAHEHLEKVYAGLGPEFVTDAETLSFLQLACLRFVRRYDALFGKFLAASRESPESVEARAYVRNEDRFYLFPAYTASFVLAKNDAQWPPERLDRMITALVQASTRRAENGESSLVADRRLYRDGMLFTRLDGAGRHQVGFEFFAPPAAAVRAVEAGEILLFPSEDNALTFISSPLDNARLETCFDRENPLKQPCLWLMKSAISSERAQLGSQRVQLNSDRAELDKQDKDKLDRAEQLKGIFDEKAP